MNSQNHNEDDDESSFSLPQRYLAVLLAFVTLYHGFLCRNSYHESIKIIVKRNYSQSNITINCKNLEALTSFEEHYDGIRYVWDEKFLRTNFILRQVGYISIHIVAGYFSDKYGAKNIVAVSIIATSLTVLCIPVSISQTKGDKTVAYIFSFLAGLSHGPQLPGIATFLSHWIPRSERAFLCSIAFFGMFYAVATLNITVESLIKNTNNWTLPCYINGGIGIPVFIVWWFFAYSDPSSNPYMTRSERIYLDKEMSKIVDHRTKSVPLKKIFLSLDVWALVIGSIGHLCLWYFAIGFLKTYMHDVLHFSLSHSRTLSFVSYIAFGMSSHINGFVVDWILRKDYVNLSTIRKVFTNLGTMRPAIYMLVASFAACHRGLFKFIFLTCNVLWGCVFAGIRMGPMDIAPNYSGVLTALINGIGILSAMFFNSIVDTLTPNKTLKEYRNIFCIMLGVSSVSNLFFIICTRIRLQKWNTPTFVKEKNK